MASMFRRVGGAAAVSALVDDFYDQVERDLALAPYFTGIDMTRQKGHMRKLISVLLGEGETYPGRGMAEAHAHLHITDIEFNLVLHYLSVSLAKFQVPVDIQDHVLNTAESLRTSIVSAEPEG